MSTSASTLWRTLREILSTGDWIPLQRIYSEIASRLTFDDGDLRPEVGNVKQRAWQRNVRNVLGHHEKKGAVERASNGAKYRLSETRDPWSASEINTVVSDYLTMLALEQQGIKYSKAGHRRKVLSQLQQRSAQSLEFKYANISAVLADMDLPYINGYKPRTHYQKALRDAVSEQLQRNSELEARFRAIAASPPPKTPPPDPTTAFTSTPIQLSERSELSIVARQGRTLDYAMIEARSAALGTAGEEWVIELERSRLVLKGRGDLAEKVEWVSRTQGDGLGYDIASFEPNGDSLFIEVKTTSGGPEMPFFITPRELALSRECAAQFRLYRVYCFKTTPRVYVLSGDVASQLDLVPKVFSARLRAAS